MFEFIKNSLANRLLFAFLAIGALPFGIFLIYTLILSETKIVNKLVLEQHHHIEQLSKTINNHLNALSKEVSFLARLDVMDDIISEDIDKRISRLLEQKEKDYNLDLDFLVIDEKADIIASSNRNRRVKSAARFYDFNASKGNFFHNNTFYIYTQIFASFDANKSLGYLLLEYDLKNLEQFLNESKNGFAYLKEQSSGKLIGTKPDIKLGVKSQKDSISIGEYLIVYQQMPGALQQWYIFYAVKKDIALSFFYNFIRFMLYLSPLILLLIAFISYKFSYYIVKPIEELTEVTDEIVISKDYSKYLDMASTDEIGKLAKSFNTLLTTVDKTLFASDAKSSFISNMSHELKTPLNAIIGFSQYLITYEKLSDEQLDIVSNIEASSQYLLEMIHGILDIAKIESGKMDVNLSQCDCLSLLQECFNMLEPLADDKGLSFEFKHEKYAISTLETDMKIFKQIVLNLLSNAIKYTQTGSVVLELSSEEGLLVRVRDTGIGIEAEEMGKLFKEFSRIDNTLSSKQKGTGLGLSLSKKLAYLIGGDIKLSSAGINRGVCAEFSIRNLDESLSKEKR